MGTWGTALFSDDLAADLRSDFHDWIGEGLDATEALDKLMSEYASQLKDPNEESVFWLAIAETSWRVGRPESRAIKRALEIIESGADLERWETPNDQQKRRRVLEKVREKLLSAPPPPRRIPKPYRAANDWEVGEVVGYRLRSGNWTLFRVVGHSEDKGGRQAICESMDWESPEIPDADTMANIPLRKSSGLQEALPFILGEPRRKKDVKRFLRTGVRTHPVQERLPCWVFLIPRLDEMLNEFFGLG